MDYQTALNEYLLQGQHDYGVTDDNGVFNVYTAASSPFAHGNTTGYTGLDAADRGFNEGNYLNSLRNQFNIDPSISNDQIRQYFTQNGLPDPIGGGGNFFSDIFHDIGTQISNAFQNWKANPLTPATTPLEAKITNAVTGQNVQPLRNQYGGATDQDRQDERQSGMDTEPFDMLDFFANNISAGFAAGYGANALAGAGSVGTTASGTPAGFGDAAYGFGGTNAAAGATSGMSQPVGGGGGGNGGGQIQVLDDYGNPMFVNGPDAAANAANSMDLGNFGVDAGSSSAAAGPATSSTGGGLLDSISNWMKGSTAGISNQGLAGAMGNLVLNQYLAQQAKNAGQSAANQSNALDQPQRAPFQQAATNMVQNPQDFLTNNPFATSLAQYYKNNVIPASIAKSGNTGFDTDRLGAQFATALSGNYNDLLNTLMVGGGFNQGTGFSGSNALTGNLASLNYQGKSFAGLGDLAAKMFGTPSNPQTPTTNPITGSTNITG